jgi:hypothetical protein
MKVYIVVYEDAFTSFVQKVFRKIEDAQQFIKESLIDKELKIEEHELIE